MTGDGRHCDRRRDAEEDQEGRHQETAADAEHAGDESDGEPHRENDEYVDRQVCDRKIDLQARGPRLELKWSQNRCHRCGEKSSESRSNSRRSPTNGRPTKSPQETPGSHLRLSWREGVAGRTPREWVGTQQKVERILAMFTGRATPARRFIVRDGTCRSPAEACAEKVRVRRRRSRRSRHPNAQASSVPRAAVQASSPRWLSPAPV